MPSARKPTRAAARKSLLRGEIVEQFAGGQEERGGAAHHGLVEEVLSDHRLADAIGSDEDDVGGLVDPGQREELVDVEAVDFLRPVIVEVDHRLEAADPAGGQASFETALLASRFFAAQQLFEPRRGGDRRPVAEQAVPGQRRVAVGARAAAATAGHRRRRYARGPRRANGAQRAAQKWQKIHREPPCSCSRTPQHRGSVSTVTLTLPATDRGSEP
jgi:hypothetical protein